ncbi:hypothetical protein [Methylobacterium bullatum]|uniref:Uncharacterized protein n=1 Tax=Methylobacterium bullatum TaxID=570505 RepID=A0A679K8J0_9HYPH|nr:hypothetical protein MBLL_03359 [Methylobacterium bullatum]
MAKSSNDTRRTAEAFVHRTLVDILVRQARAVDEFTHPEAFAAAVAARSPANRAALARLGESLVRATQPASPSDEEAADAVGAIVASRAAATAHVPGTLV